MGLRHHREVCLPATAEVDPREDLGRMTVVRLHLGKCGSILYGADQVSARTARSSTDSFAEVALFSLLCHPFRLLPAAQHRAGTLERLIIRSGGDPEHRVVASDPLEGGERGSPADRYVRSRSECEG